LLRKIPFEELLWIRQEALALDAVFGQSENGGAIDVLAENTGMNPLAQIA
jgi:hypothetical protein